MNQRLLWHKLVKSNADTYNVIAIQDGMNPHLLRLRWSSANTCTEDACIYIHVCIVHSYSSVNILVVLRYYSGTSLIDPDTLGPFQVSTLCRSPDFRSPVNIQMQHLGPQIVPWIWRYSDFRGSDWRGSTVLRFWCKQLRPSDYWKWLTAFVVKCSYSY